MQKMYQENIRNKTTKSKSQKIILKDSVHVQKNTSLESPGLVSRTRIATSATSLHKGHLQDLHWLDYFGSNQIRIDGGSWGPRVPRAHSIAKLHLFKTDILRLCHHIPRSICNQSILLWCELGHTMSPGQTEGNLCPLESVLATQLFACKQKYYKSTKFWSEKLICYLLYPPSH